MYHRPSETDALGFEVGYEGCGEYEGGTGGFIVVIANVWRMRRRTDIRRAMTGACDAGFSGFSAWDSNEATEEVGVAGSWSYSWRTTDKRLASELPPPPPKKKKKKTYNKDLRRIERNRSSKKPR